MHDEKRKSQTAEKIIIMIINSSQQPPFNSSCNFFLFWFSFLIKIYTQKMQNQKYISKWNEGENRQTDFNFISCIIGFYSKTETRSCFADKKKKKKRNNENIKINMYSSVVCVYKLDIFFFRFISSMFLMILTW